MELECRSVTTALKNFKVVVHKCFGQEVVDGYENAISKFSKDLRKIGRDPTLKVHILEAHVVQFLKRKHIEYPGKGLGFFAEQASESVHCDWDNLWTGHKYKRSLEHKDYDS